MSTGATGASVALTPWPLTGKGFGEITAGPQGLLLRSRFARPGSIIDSGTWHLGRKGQHRRAATGPRRYQRIAHRGHIRAMGLLHRRSSPNPP